MIPANISYENVLRALEEIDRNGIPERRRATRYNLSYRGKRYPPKYVISLANKYANGLELNPADFSGGTESNYFLKRIGFNTSENEQSEIIPYNKVADAEYTNNKTHRVEKHNERCPQCKATVKAMLARIYSDVRTSYSLDLGTLPSEFKNSPFQGDLEEIYRFLQEHRGNADFVHARALPPVDYFIPSQKLIVEFDESQHFTICRKLTLSKYPNEVQLGFSRMNWMELCDKIHAQDNDPPYRDEQRAWYDTVRDLAPSNLGMRPTVRLYAGQREWCSLNPQNKNDLETFERILQADAESRSHVQPSSTGLTGTPKHDTFRIALVLPQIWAPNNSDTTERAQAPLRFQPSIPVASDFAGRETDLVVFPEAYIRNEDGPRRTLLRDLAKQLKTHLLVGVTQGHNGRDADWETLMLFGPEGDSETFYHKHATAGAVAFETPSWEPRKQLPVFTVNGVTVGCTICHDSYLGLLQHYLAKQGAQIWINPSYDNVIHEKWESIFRLRAVENKVTSLCTLHDNVARGRRRRIRPFGFGPDGSELSGHLAGDQSRPKKLSECNIPGIYIIDCNLGTPSAKLNPGLLPTTIKQPFPRQRSGDLVKIALIEGFPYVGGEHGWIKLSHERLVDVYGLKLGLGIIPGDKLFDISSFVREQERIYNLDPDQARPIFWNQWLELPTEPSRLIDMMMGRTLEMLAPVVLSDQKTIYEVTEIAGGTKTIRRISFNSSEADVDVKFALGLWNSFKITWASLTDIAAPWELFKPFVQKYLSLL